MWHGRLGHPSDQVFSLLSKDIHISERIENNVEGQGDLCFRAKQTRTQFVASESHALFQLIHCDICFAYRVPSLCGAKDFRTIVDDASRAVWVYLMRAKRGFVAFVIMVKLVLM